MSIRATKPMKRGAAGARTAKQFWQSIDWKPQDAVIARRLGCNDTTVNSWRKKLNIPPSVDDWKTRNLVYPK